MSREALYDFAKLFDNEGTGLVQVDWRKEAADLLARLGYRATEESS